jgi:hypothetical protein
MGNHFCECPALQFGKRLGFDNANTITDLTLIALVMHVVFFRTLDDFVELRVRNTGHVFDDEGLVHFIGNHHADAGFTKMDLGVRRSLAHDRYGCGLDELSAFEDGDRSQNASGLATDLLDTGWIFQGASGALEAEIERFVLEFLETNLEFVCGKLAGLFGFSFGHGSD